MTKTIKFIFLVVLMIVVATITIIGTFLFIFSSGSNTYPLGRIEKEQNAFKILLISKGVVDEEDCTVMVASDWTYDYGILEFKKDGLTTNLYIEAREKEYVIELSFSKSSNSGISQDDKDFIAQITDCAKSFFGNAGFSIDLIEANYDDSYLKENFNSNSVKEESKRACYLTVKGEAEICYKFKTEMLIDDVCLTKVSIRYTRIVPDNFYEEGT